MKAILRNGFLALAIMALAVPADAGPFEDGLGAYNRKDYAEAMKLFHRAAEQGDPDSQAMLGVMYYIGEGVPQDYVLAHMWHNLATAHGSPLSGNLRDDIALMMTPDQIAEAQRMAREWLEKHPQ